MNKGLINKISKRVSAALIIGLAIVLPTSTMADNMVKLEGSLGVANVTRGDRDYKQAVSASYDEVVKLQVYYHNMEQPDSNKVAKDLTVKINIPAAVGKTQTVSSKISAANGANVVNSTAKINLDRESASLQYIPSSAVWKHNVGTNANPLYVETKISDAVVTSGAGLRLEDEKPCHNFAATVTVLARVMVPGVTVKKEVSVNKAAWAVSNFAKPEEVLTYMITYQNTGNTTQNNVIIRDSLPVKMTLIPGSTYLYNSNNANGVRYSSDNITRGGIDIGDYKPGAGAYVKFQVKMPAATQLVCGDTTFTNVGVARPQGMAEYFAQATTRTNRACDSNPQYQCTAFGVTAGAERKATVNKYQIKAEGGATFKRVVINWGDGSTPLTTDVTNAVGASHQYAENGSYTIVATTYFTVNGTEIAVDGCSQVVNFTGPTGTPEVPAAPATELTKSGPSQMLALFAVVAIAGTVASRLFMSRRFN